MRARTRDINDLIESQNRAIDEIISDYREVAVGIDQLEKIYTVLADTESRVETLKAVLLGLLHQEKAINGGVSQKMQH